MSLRGLIGALCLMCWPALGLAQPAPGLLIDEVKTSGEDRFVELTNHTSSALDLDGFYLSNSALYYRIVAAPGPSRDGEFVVALPAVELLPGERFVVALDEVQAFSDVWGNAPNAGLYEGGDDVVALAPAWDGSIGPGRWQPSSAGTLVLFYWDGESDLVVDFDILRWDPESPIIDKTNLGLDGPDPDNSASFYLPDTPAAQQWVVPAPNEKTLVRVRLEQNEVFTGGNGAGGHDETSEPWPRNFSLSRRATPGDPNIVGFDVFGFVTLTGGEPAGAARVAINELGIAVTADDIGMFRVEGVPVGEWTIEAQHLGLSMAHPIEVEGDLEVFIDLGGSESLRGRVALADAIPPNLGDTRVLIEDSDVYVLTDGDGDFIIDGLTPGSYTVEFSKVGYTPHVRDVVLPAEQFVEVTLFSHHPIDVVVRLFGDLPMGSRIALEQVNGERRYALLTEQDGASIVRFTGVLPDRYMLTVDADHNALLSVGPLDLLRHSDLAVHPVATTARDGHQVDVSCSATRTRNPHPSLWFVLALFAVVLRLTRR